MIHTNISKDVELANDHFLVGPASIEPTGEADSFTVQLVALRLTGLGSFPQLCCVGCSNI